MPMSPYSGWRIYGELQASCKTLRALKNPALQIAIDVASLTYETYILSQ